MLSRIVTRDAFCSTFTVIHEGTRYDCLKYMYLRWQCYPPWAAITQRVTDYWKCFKSRRTT